MNLESYLIYNAVMSVQERFNGKLFKVQPDEILDGKSKQKTNIMSMESGLM